MKFDLRTSQGVAQVMKTYRIPGDVWLHKGELLIECRKVDVDRTHFLLFLLNMPIKFQVEGNLPWYKNRFQRVKVVM